MSNILTEIIGLLTQGITTFGQGLGSGINATITSMFIDSTGTNPALSTFGGVVVIFGAIALVTGITYVLFNFITKWGNR